MVSREGHAKVLDFGLAKLMEPAAAGASQTPTDVATAEGAVLGTVGYMSPEQLKGAEVDPRSDVFSFGCLLYEAVTRRRAFSGETGIDVMHQILHDPPRQVREFNPQAPLALRRMIGRCLEKEPGRRYQSMSDLAFELAGLVERYDEHFRVIDESARKGAEDVEQAAAPRRTGRPALAWTGSLMLALGLVVGFVLGRGGGPPDEVASPPGPPLSATRTVVKLPDSARLALPLGGAESRVLALSPNGRHLVYVGAGEGTRQLYHRDLTRFEDPVPVPGTEDALFAFFSPSSSELGFLTADRVKKVALGGGAATPLSRARTPVFATWLDDTIYFADRQGYGLSSIPADGGESSELFGSEERFGFRATVSSVLPGGRAALVSVRSRGSSSRNYDEIWVVSLDGRKDKPLAINGYDARYLPSGHLVFGRGGSVMAAPFDLERLDLLADAAPALEGVALESLFAHVHAAFAANGTVAFVPGQDLALGRLAWVDQQGNEGVLEVEERVYGVFDLAPDDQRFAVQVADVRDYVWIWEAKGGGRDLASPGTAGSPVWSPDGTALVLGAWMPGSASFEVVLHELQGGAARSLLSSESSVYPYSWVQPGRIGIYQFGESRTGVLSVDSASDPLWVHERASGGTGGIWGAALSPDGAWIAYSSNEGTGRSQVWLEEIDGETRKQVSTDGGLEPVWCRSCRDLFYRQSNRILASRITLDPQLEIGPQRLVFEAPDFVDTPGISYRVSSDGERLYYVRRGEPPVRDRIHIVNNWFEELRRLLPVD